jgi:hypothetical protein
VSDLIAKGSRGKAFLAMSACILPLLSVAIFFYAALQIGSISKTDAMEFVWSQLDVLPFEKMWFVVIAVVVLLAFHAVAMWFGTKVIIGHGSMSRTTYFFLSGLAGFVFVALLAIYVAQFYVSPSMLIGYPWYVYPMALIQVLALVFIVSQGLTLFAALFLWEFVGRFTFLEKALLND